MPPESSCRIRPATASDAGILAELRYEFRAALDPAAEPAGEFLARCEGWMQTQLAPASPWRCWLVEEGTRTVGMVWLMIIEKLPNPIAEPERYGYVSSLYLKPELRGQGVGSGLLEICIKTCESLGCDAIFLWPTARSRSLYLRHGFAVRDDLLERRIAPVPHHA